MPPEKLLPMASETRLCPFFNREEPLFLLLQLADTKINKGPREGEVTQ